MLTYLRHPKYGTKVSTLAQEVEDDEANGWEQFDPFAPEIGEPVVEVVEPKKKSKDNTPSFLE